MERDSRTYTRKQIEEALKYWTKRLDVLNESITRTIQALIDEFGEKRVISREKDYRLTKEDLQKIYDVLNRCLFNGKLGRIGLEYWPEAFIVDQVNDHLMRSEVFNKNIDAAPYYGVWSGVSKDVKDKDGNIVDVRMSDDMIMINKSLVKDSVFIFVVATICHEMIHYAYRLTDTYHDKVLYSSQHNNQGFDSHSDEFFQEKMKLARAEGIDVIERPDPGDTFDSINRNAAELLKNVISEDDDNDETIVSATDRSIIARGPGSDTFCMIEFD